VGFGATWKTTILTAVLAACTGYAGEPPPIPDPPDFAQEAAPPARLNDQIAQAAEVVSQPASQRVFDQYLQTINWLSRPKPVTALPAPAADDDGVRTAAAQVPGETLPPPVADPNVVPLPHDLFNYDIAPGVRLEFDGLFRGYYRNDQRIEWSGLETVFGAEGVFRPLIQCTTGNWTVSAQGEFFINEKYGSSILSDPQRDLFRANFQIDPFEVFQLFGQAQYGDWLFRVGKTRTPFGNYQGPTFTNSLIDAPFIRTDVIPWTETGLFVRWQPGPWSFDAAITNGEPDLDTNSSKAGIARVGYSGDFWTLGASLKIQDGVSSELQKRFNNIYGIDYSMRFGRIVAYGEVTYDEYGYRHAAFVFGNPLNFGVRSLYHRDVFSGSENVPVHGVGYYVGLGYRGARWLWDGTYGTYFPQQLGIPAHDTNIQRGVVKCAFAITPNFQVYVVGIIENNRPPDGVLRNDKMYAILSGVQLTF
jgi:hypothetical protein